MEENKKMENGIITEEALEQIAGGLNVKKAALIGVLAAASVAIVGGGGFLIKKIHDRHKNKKEKEKHKKNTLDGLELEYKPKQLTPKQELSCTPSYDE